MKYLVLNQLTEDRAHCTVLNQLTEDRTHCTVFKTNGQKFSTKMLFTLSVCTNIVHTTIWWSQYLPGKSKDFFRASLLEDSLGGGNGAIGLEILCGPSRLILSKRDEYKMLI